MGRYIRMEVINQPNDFVDYVINDFIMKQGFKYILFKGEYVYKSGDGFIEIPKFFSYKYEDGIIRIEAWTRTVSMIGIYGKENDLSGFSGKIAKDAYKSDIEQLIMLLKQHAGNQQMNGYPLNSQPSGDTLDYARQTYGYQQNNQPQYNNSTVYVRGFDTEKYAKMTLGYGIAGLCLSWIWMGIFFDIMAFVYFDRARKSSRRGSAIAGLICAILGFVISVVVTMVFFYYCREHNLYF